MRALPSRRSRQAAASLAPPSFFEGPEKKVELVLREGHPSLRSLGRAFFERAVRAAGARIVSERSNAHLDAYLLSESSLFVYDRALTMITCGRTTLVDAVVLLAAALPPDAIELLVYERKSEHFPDAQPTRFADDVARLETLVRGRTLRLGVDEAPAVTLFHSLAPHTPRPRDRTLEVLMQGIPEHRAAPFRGGARVRELGLPRALAGFELDELAFEPEGYSLNGLSGEAFVTLHVTPGQPGSYVSLETNAPGAVPEELITEAALRFEPEAVDVLAFEPDARRLAVTLPGYALEARTEAVVSGFHLTFLRFLRA